MLAQARCLHRRTIRGQKVSPVLANLKRRTGHQLVIDKQLIPIFGRSHRKGTRLLDSKPGLSIVGKTKKIR